MNLVHTKTYRLERKSPKDYAILSHTWGSEPDYEVTYEDMMNNGQKKPGYGKIVGACNEAAGHGYEYVWIDTCCIDKKSSAELSEAINSMLRLYSQAGECIAYLSDVTSDLGDESWRSTSDKADGSQEVGRFRSCWRHESCCSMT